MVRNRKINYLLFCLIYCDNIYGIKRCALATQNIPFNIILRECYKGGKR
jgi:hypothetical protein